MALSVQVHTQRIHAKAEELLNASGRLGKSVQDTFEEWAESTAEIMSEEIPKDTHETADSVTVIYRRRGGQHVARIGPTNTDDRGRPVGFYLNYGAAGRDPADFIGSTANRTAPPDFDVRSVL